MFVGNVPSSNFQQNSTKKVYNGMKAGSCDRWLLLNIYKFYEFYYLFTYNGNFFLIEVRLCYLNCYRYTIFNVFCTPFFIINFTFLSHNQLSVCVITNVPMKMICTLICTVLMNNSKIKSLSHFYREYSTAILVRILISIELVKCIAIFWISFDLFIFSNSHYYTQFLWNTVEWSGFNRFQEE